MAANPYTSVTVSGYNASPPPDDGSTTADNKLEWDKHKTKLGDPLKTAVESVNSNVSTAFGNLIMTTDPGEETVLQGLAWHER